MKSIQYGLLKGNPHNLDDCIHYYLMKQEGREPPCVNITLRIEERLSEYSFLYQYVGKHDWHFSDGLSVSFEKIYSAFDEMYIFDLLSSYEKAVSLADAELNQDLEALARLGISNHILKHEGGWVMKR